MNRFLLTTLVIISFFTVNAQPVITSFSPLSGIPGSTVIISGNNFSPISSNNVVYFGAVAAIVNSATSNTLTVTVPFGSTYKPISATVNNLTAYSQFSFKILFNACDALTANSFASPVNIGYPETNNVVADFDNDGKPDIAFTNNLGFSVLRNLSAGGSISFSSPKTFSSNIYPYGICIGDLDGDGKLDVVVTSYNSNSISIFKNTSVVGNISFAAKIDYATGNNPFGVVIADCDSDGKPDIIVTNEYDFPGTISIFRNNSSTGILLFAQHVDYVCGNDPRNLEVGDIDGDGKPDIVTANQSSKSISILKNNSSPGTIFYAPKFDIAMAPSTYPESVAIGDIDGDGKPDIAVANNDDPGTVSLLRNTGTTNNISFAARVDFPAGRNPYQVCMEDIDGDGKTDVAVSNQVTDDVSILKNISTTGNLMFNFHADYALSISSPRFLSIADLDADGKPDLIASDRSYGIDILKNNLSSGACSFIKILGKDTVCVSPDTVIYSTQKNAGCNDLTFTTIGGSAPHKVISGSPIIKLQFSGPGIVKITIQTQPQTSCKSLYDTLIIHVLKPPDPLDIGPDITLCENSTYILHATQGFKNYKWQDGSSDSIFVVRGSGKYYVTATDYCGKALSDTVNVFSAPGPFIDIGNDTSKCNKDTLILTATAGFTSYTWSPNYNISNILGQTVKVFPAVDTVYKVIAVKDTGCIATASIKIKVYNSPKINLGNDTSFCMGNSAILNAGSGFVSYLWNTGSILQQINAASAGQYFVAAKDINNCISRDTLNIISLYQNPVINLKKDSAICQGNILVLNAGAGYSKYLWQDSSTSQTYNVTGVGKYWVTVTDNHQCIGSDTTQIKLILPLPSNFIIKDTMIICGESSIILKANMQFVNYLWSTGANTKKISVSKPGMYWLQVVNNQGCTAKEFINVTSQSCTNTIYFPNTFTPNKDGLNDIFKAISIGTLEKFRLRIYDRFGKKIFETYDVNTGWDGRYKGIQLNPDTFVWHCEYQFNNEQTKTRKGIIISIN